MHGVGTYEPTCTPLVMCINFFVLDEVDLVYTFSGIARGVHVDSYAPSQYTSAPLKMYFL